MNIRRKNRLWIACAVLAGLALTIGLVLYALRSNIDLFYTPGEILYGKRETQQMPEVGQRLRVGGMVMPGSVQRDPNSLKVTFTIYDAEGSVDVSYEGILPDLFREGQGVVVQGELEKGNHILAKEVLAKHDENYTPPEVPGAGNCAAAVRVSAMGRGARRCAHDGVFPLVCLAAVYVCGWRISGAGQCFRGQRLYRHLCCQQLQYPASGVVSRGGYLGRA